MRKKLKAIKRSVITGGVAACLIMTPILSDFSVFSGQPAVVQAASSVMDKLNDVCNRELGTQWNGMFYGAIQCKGWAAKIMSEIFGIGYIGVYDKQKYYIPKACKGITEVGRLSTKQMTKDAMTALLDKAVPGDFIQVQRRRAGVNGHSMIVYGINAEEKKITILDCNGDGKNTVRRYVQSYDTFYKKNRAMSVYHAQNNDWNNDIPDENAVGNPEISNVSIPEISADKLVFKFTTNANTRFVRIEVYDKKTSGKSRQDYYQDVAKNYTITLRFTADAGRNQIVRIYAYAQKNGQYVNETLHTLTYGPAIGEVQLPEVQNQTQNQIQNQIVRLTDEEVRALCFDAKYYAEHNPDVKAAYGYDEAKLYEHWVVFGQREGRGVSILWDPKFYLENNSDLKAAFKNDYVAALEHFRSYGYAEYRTTSDFYDGNYYKNKYLSEFKNMNSKDLMFHMRNFGLREGRWASNARYKGVSSWV